MRGTNIILNCDKCYPETGVMLIIYIFIPRRFIDLPGETWKLRGTWCWLSLTELGENAKKCVDRTHTFNVDPNIHFNVQHVTYGHQLRLCTSITFTDSTKVMSEPQPESTRGDTHTHLGI